MKSSARRPLCLLLWLAAFAACQGGGRVHEQPPATYPDDGSAPLVSDPAHAEPAPELLPPEPLPAPRFAEPPASESASAPTEPSRPALPERSAPATDDRDGFSAEPEPGPVAGWGSDAASSPARAEARKSAESPASSLGQGNGALQQDSARGRVLSRRPPPEERPGLATRWGETRYSPAREVDFERQSQARPSTLIELHYNDRAGARRMLPEGYETRAERWALGVLRVRLEDASGRTLPALASGQRRVGLGEVGERYALAIENTSGRRFEVVASVDGLDVLDGEDGSFEKRGYLVGPYARVVIDGFRRSEAEVAAFRFGDVSGSYAASKGKARNVGVIGIAVFEERRPVYQPPVWRDPSERDDTWQRQNADPFPGRYARPPVW